MAVKVKNAFTNPFASFSTNQWYEALAASRPSGAGAFSAEQSEEQIIIDIDAKQIPAAIQRIVGYAFVDEDTGTPANSVLVRFAPVRHPMLPYLYAKAVAVEPYSPKGIEQSDGTKKAKVEVPDNLDKDWAAPAYANYQKAKVTVSFWQPPFEVWDNGDPKWNERSPSIKQEWRRFCSKFDTAPTLDVLQADNSPFLKFAATATGGPAIGSSFPTPLGTYLIKTELVLKWYYVPHDWVFLNDVSVKINDCIGKVNSNVAFGTFVPGTLLMMPPVFEKYQFPVIPQNVGEKVFAYNITLRFQLFDPDPANPVYRGHNLMPFNKAGGANGGPMWLAASRDQSPTPSTAEQYRYLPSADFDKIFEFVKA